MHLPSAKKIIQTILLLALVGAVSASGKPRQEYADAAAKEQLIIWCYYETDAQQQAMDELTAGFNAVSAVYTIQWEYVPMTDFSKRLSMGYTEDALPDLVIMDNPDMPYYIKTGMLADITDLERELRIQEDYYPVLFGTIYDNDKLYGLPLNCNNVALFYHPEMLEEVGIAPPTDWENFADAVDRLNTEEHYGFLMSAISGEQGAFQIMPWILSAGEAINEIGGEATTRAYDYLYSLIDSGGMDANCINYSQNDVARKFINGDTAMMENGPWILPMLEDAGTTYGIVPLPADKKQQVVVGGENIGVLRGKNTDGAKEFLKYCASDNVMNNFCSRTGVLPTKMTLSISEDERTKVFREQMQTSVLRTENEHWNTLHDKLSEGIYEMLAAEKSASDVAAELSDTNLK